MFANIIISVIFSYKKESLEKENQNVFEKNSIAYNTSIYRISNILNHRIRTEHPFKQPTKYYDINEYHYYLRLNNEPLKQFYLPPSLANTFFYLNTMKDGDSVRVSMTTFKGKEYLLSLEPL